MSAKPKAKEANPFPQGKKNQDLLQRLNHLYQANTYLASLSRELGSSMPATPNESSRKNDRKARKGERAEDARQQARPDALGVVVRRSNHRFKVMVKHNILSTDPALKRSFCKGCNSICIPGLNARVRVRPSKIHGNKVITTCLTCSTSRTIPAPPIQEAVSSVEATALPDSDNSIPMEIATEDPSELQAPLSGLPAPSSTSTGPNDIPPLDGINRAAKRRKLSKKPQFWRKEAVVPAPSSMEATVGPETVASRKAKQFDDSETAAVTPSADVAPAMTIPEFRNPSLEEEGANDALPEVEVAPAKQRQQKGQKQKGQKGGKGANAAAQPVKQDGHLVWRGEELVTGWGDPVQPQAQGVASK